MQKRTDEDHLAIFGALLAGAFILLMLIAFGI